MADRRTRAVHAQRRGPHDMVKKPTAALILRVLASALFLIDGDAGRSRSDRIILQAPSPLEMLGPLASPQQVLSMPTLLSSKSHAAERIVLQLYGHALTRPYCASIRSRCPPPDPDGPSSSPHAPSCLSNLLQIPLTLMQRGSSSRVPVL
ncbi:hypothetical protein OH77DRAFT_1065063 [Trametes cingulata]|nr:hypothetical protein OH77DRAFT_1065063 [Trametes cingulata]